MGRMSVRVGFVPSIRIRPSDWNRRTRAESLAAFGQIEGLVIVTPDGAALDAKSGFAPHSMGRNMNQAEVVG